MIVSVNGTRSKWTTEEMLMLYHLKVAKKTHKEIAEIMGDKLHKREYSENLIHKKWQQTDWVGFLDDQGEKEAALSEIAEKEANIAAKLAQAQEIIDNLPSWTTVQTAVQDISDLPEAKVFIEKLARVVYVLART